MLDNFGGLKEYRSCFLLPTPARAEYISRDLGRIKLAFRRHAHTLPWRGLPGADGI